MKGRLYYYVEELSDGRIIVYLTSKDYFKKKKSLGCFEEDEVEYHEYFEWYDVDRGLIYAHHQSDYWGLVFLANPEYYSSVDEVKSHFVTIIGMDENKLIKPMNFDIDSLGLFDKK